MNRNELIAQMETVMPIVNNWIQLNDQIYKRKKSLNELEYAIKESKPGIKAESGRLFYVWRDFSPSGGMVYTL